MTAGATMRLRACLRSATTSGRPKAEEPGIRVSTWVPVSTFDALAKYAIKHDRSVSALLRDALTRAVAPHKPPEPR